MTDTRDADIRLLKATLNKVRLERNIAESSARELILGGVEAVKQLVMTLLLKPKPPALRGGTTNDDLPWRSFDVDVEVEGKVEPYVVVIRPKGASVLTTDRS